LHHGPLVCLNTKQADPARIKKGKPKERRLLSKSDKGYLPFLYVDLSPKNALPRLHFIISRGSSKNGGIVVLKDKPIGLIKWPKARLENLLITATSI